MKLNILSTIFALLAAMVTAQLQPTFSPTMAPTFLNLDTGLIPINMTELLHSNLSAYEPSPIVQMFHNLPHWQKNKEGLIVANDKVVFLAGNQKGATEYAQSLIGFPILLFIIGIISLVLLTLGILGYMNWLVPRMGPVEMDQNDDSTAAIALWTHKVESSRKMWVIYFFVAVAVALFGNHIMFYGDSLYKEGFVILTKSLADIDHNIREIATSSEEIRIAFGHVEANILACSQKTTGQCQQEISSQKLKDLIAREYLQLDAMKFQTELVAEAVYDANAGLVKYDGKKQKALWSFYAVTLALCLCFIGCFFTKQSFFMKISIGVAQFIMVCLLALCTFELIFMMGLGDFCMDPTESVVNAIDNKDLQGTAKYFGNCDPATANGKEPGTGDNKLRMQLAAAYEARTVLGRALQTLYAPDIYLDPSIIRVGGPVCEPNRIDIDVEEAFYALQELAPQYQNIAQQISCGSLHNIWRLTFEVAMCHNTLIGIYGLWLAQIITTIGIFLTTIAASIMMLYFDEFWDISATMDRKIKSRHDDDDGDVEDPFAVESDTTESNPVSRGTRSDGYAPVTTSAV